LHLICELWARMRVKNLHPRQTDGSNSVSLAACREAYAVLYPVYTIEQTSSRPGVTLPPGSNVGLGLAHS